MLAIHRDMLTRTYTVNREYLIYISSVQRKKVDTNLNSKQRQFYLPVSGTQGHVDTQIQ